MRLLYSAAPYNLKLAPHQAVILRPLGKNKKTEAAGALRSSEGELSSEIDSY
jgi:hypothetical protein